MKPCVYEKEADTANYIYFKKYRVTEEWAPDIFPHYHDSIEFVFMVGGENRIHINTQEKIVSAGEIAFVRCFEPHYYMPREVAEYFVALISSQYLGVCNNFSKMTFPSFMERGEHFGKILEFLNYMYSVWDAGDEAIKGADLLLGLMRKFYSMETVKNAKATQTFVEVLKYINEHFREEISLGALADRFGYVKNYLSGLFNKFTGMKFREYINRRKVNILGEL